MRRLLAATTLTAAALAPPLASPAAAESPGEGFGCGYSFFLDPADPFGDAQYVEVDGGPILLDDGPTVRTGRLACSLQLNAARHSDTDLLRSVSGTTTGVAALGPSVARVDVPVDTTIYHCTEVQVDDVGTFYWDPDAEAWSTDPDAPCGNWISKGPSPVPDLTDIEWEVVDSLVCPVLALAAPPEGDIDGLWDCPPYDWETR